VALSHAVAGPGSRRTFGVAYIQDAHPDMVGKLGRDEFLAMAEER
jgi:hypothetical protein